MKSKLMLCVLLAIGLMSTFGTFCQAATFTWIGGANVDWDNPANWTGGIVPAQSDMGATSGTVWNTVQFIGSTMPAVNVKDLGYNNGYYFTSKLELNSGGAISMGLQSRDNGLCKNGGGSIMLVIGDGISGGTEDVSLRFTESLILARHAGGTFTTIVNQDGALDIQGTLTMTYNNANGNGLLDINGGSVTADYLDMQGSYVYFGGSTRAELSDGGSFTIDGTVVDTMLTRADSIVTIRFEDKSNAFFSAQYGGDLPDLATVEGSLGSLFVSETDWTLFAEDVGGGYFRVRVVPEPTSLVLFAMGVFCFMARRHRKR